jgi:hypothetical protein
MGRESLEESMRDQQRDEIRGVTIKSFVMDDSYEAVYGGGRHDCKGTFVRCRIAGFAVIRRGSFVRREQIWQDEVAPFELGELGFALCESIDNFLGVVKVGEEMPEWMEAYISDPIGER